jgi:putative hydrolase of HD superfamily
MDINIDRLVKLFFEVGTLRKITRSHKQTLLTNDNSDNIASHSFRVTIIAYFLAVSEDVDVNKVVLMALFHDIEETRIGDQNWVHKAYIKAFEDEVLEDQLKDIVEEDQLYEIMKEYNERKTPEAKIAKDADHLDQIYLLREYVENGNKEAARWLRGKAHEERLYCDTAKEIAKKAKEETINSWWANIWTDKRR